MFLFFEEIDIFYFNLKPARDEFLVINVVHILAVIPATSCSAERSFSALRRLKTYLHNTIGQQRVINVHRTY